MLKKLLIRGSVCLLGTATVLTWWTIHPGKSQSNSSDRIPPKFENGGNRLNISVETSAPATMRVEFTDHNKEFSSQEVVETWEKIPVGSRSWSVDVPAGVGGYIELDADNPNVGDTLMMQVSMNGEEVDQQSERLDHPLEPDYGFGLQDYFEHYSKAKRQMSGAGSEKAQ
jgi:hypothetical protein